MTESTAICGWYPFETIEEQSSCLESALEYQDMEDISGSQSI